MFGCKKKAATPTPAPSASPSRLPTVGKAGMMGLTTVATLGPKKLRPHAQNLLALIGIIVLIRQVVERSRSRPA